MKIRIPLGKNELRLAFERKRSKLVPATTLENLSHELQLLLGANAILQVVQDWDATQSSDSTRFGNIINYYKDSAYLHIRNLLNALSNQYLVDGQAVPLIQTGLYGQWKPTIEKFVLHINTNRDQNKASNIIGGVHLNKIISKLTNEVERCWIEWTNKTPDTDLKQKLKTILSDSQNAARADADRINGLIGSKK